MARRPLQSVKMTSLACLDMQNGSDRSTEQDESKPRMRLQVSPHNEATALRLRNTIKIPLSIHVLIW